MYIEWCEKGKGASNKDVLMIGPFSFSHNKLINMWGS